MLVSSEKAIVLLGFIALACTMPLEEKRNDAQLLKYHDDRNADGSYDFNYELSDGQSRQEKGTFTDGKDANGNDIKVLSVTGSYSFVAPDGATFEVFYRADERGFRIERMSAIDLISPAAADTGVKSDEEEKVTTATDEDSAIVTTEPTSS